MRTKFAVCGALDAERIGATGVETGSAYRMQVEQKLGFMRFPEITSCGICSTTIIAPIIDIGRD